MELYMDEKWRLLKKGSRHGGSRRVGVGEGLLGRSASALEEARRSSSSARPSFSGRCTRLVKEQRARFYIMRRCITMLICWHDCA